jgi:hypothetical protein
MNNVIALKQRTGLVGRWSAEAHSPVTVADPAKLRTLLGLPKRRVVRAAQAMPLDFVRRHLPTLAPGVRREVERLLSGSRRLWRDEFKNIVVNQGLNDLLDVTLSGATQDTTWFVGLTDGTPTVAAGDTLASHAGWVEVTAYDETNRVAWVDAGASSQSISNAASPAVFTINANGTVIGGAFLAGVNTGTSGRLYAAGAFSGGDKTLADNDTLDVTATFTAAAA